MAATPCPVNFLALPRSAVLSLLVHFALAADPWQPPVVSACTDVALLVKYDFAYIQANKCELCGKVDESFCVMDWPTNDVPSCSLYDEMRNSIYAWYGRPFETPKWKDHFAKVSWYKVNPAYSDALLSPEAKRNVLLLKDMAEKSTGCMKVP